uniref:Uncharacterized protein n=1 Tax=Leersia perrieri TaxID=77586 RepID=A0A0G2KBI0_9ORYZ
MGAWPMLHY